MMSSFRTKFSVSRAPPAVAAAVVKIGGEWRFKARELIFEFGEEVDIERGEQLWIVDEQKWKWE